jgi:cytochrome c
MKQKTGAGERAGRVCLPRAMAMTLTLAISILAVALLSGCSDPDRVILDGLDAAGQERFRRGRSIAVPCWTCHDIAGTVKKVGPSLLGLYGRRSGMAPGYSGSPEMRAASIVWDDRMLAAFLADPARFVPGNRMVSGGVRDPSSMGDLLFYLRHVTRPGARELRPGS